MHRDTGEVLEGTRYDRAKLQRVDALWVCRRNVRKRKKGVREYEIRYKY